MSQKDEPIFTTATERVRPTFWKGRLLRALFVWYLVLWVVLAISPVDRRDWLLENLLVFVFVGFIVWSYRAFTLSDMSYILITVFMSLHAFGAHYTYSKVPLGFWIQEALELDRNHFDRIAHFCFGLLMAYPIREVFLRVVNTKGFWAYYLPLDVTLAFSGLFEIIEAALVWCVSPELGNTYLGAQGDSWDAQKDMALAGLGALICMCVTAWLHYLFNKSKRVKSPLK